jgi:hypothetical protein
METTAFDAAVAVFPGCVERLSMREVSEAIASKTLIVACVEYQMP